MMQAARPIARRRFREGLLPRAARDRGRDLPSPACAVAALSSRAAHRRALAHHRPRHQSDRPADDAGDLQHLPDHPAAGVHLRTDVVAVECLVRGRNGRDDRRLYAVHLCGDALAHAYPPRHERFGQRGEHQGGGQSAELRDGEIFQRRGARGKALRRLDGEICRTPPSSRRLRFRC